MSTGNTQHPPLSMKIFIWLLLACSVRDVLCRNLTVEERLINDLFRDYNPSARPTYDAHNPILINISISLLQLIDLDEQRQTMTTNGWINVYWYDPRLTWEPEDYEGITGISIPPTHHPWLPRCNIMNSAAEDLYDEAFFSLFGVELSSTGRVYWAPGGNLYTMCTVDITFYPFDEQRCGIQFSNWIYPGNLVNLTYEEGAGEKLLGSYAESAEWDITDHRISRLDNDFGTNSSYPEVYFLLHLRRKHLFYLTSLLIPCILLSLLAMFVFQLPPESGEKISLCTSLLLSFVVYIMVLSDSLPTTSVSVPLIQVYLLMALSSTALSVIISILVLNMYHKSDDTPPPDILLKLCFIRKTREGAGDNSDDSVIVNNQIWTQKGDANQTNDLMEEVKTREPSDTENGTLATNNLLRRIVEMLEENKKEKTSNLRLERNRELWTEVASAIDKLCFYCFGFLLSFGTVMVLAILPKMG